MTGSHNILCTWHVYPSRIYNWYLTSNLSVDSSKRGFVCCFFLLLFKNCMCTVFYPHDLMVFVAYLGILSVILLNCSHGASHFKVQTSVQLIMDFWSQLIFICFNTVPTSVLLLSVKYLLKFVFICVLSWR